MVTRINMSYARYWEGVTMVKNMHSKWADACGQIIAFDRALSTEINLTSDPFCCHIVRLFSQMSAMATMRLHVVDPGESLKFDALQGKSPLRVRLPELPRMRVGGRPLRPNATAADGRPGSLKLGNSFRIRGSSVAPEPTAAEEPTTGATARKKFSRVRTVGSAAFVGLGASNKDLNAVAMAASKYQVAHASGHLVHRKRAEEIEELASGISKHERELLLAAPCPVFATAQRIQRSIVTRLHAGGMRAPPPIVSRIFQELSSGLLFYNNATKMKEVPVPFPYVQLNAFLLNLFSLLLCPIAIASFTQVLWLSLAMAFITVCSFYAVFAVANELEDPFGSEANDMPMLEYHEEYCASLCALVAHPWLPQDQWMAKEGMWVKPRTVALAANAFSGKTGGKYSVATSGREGNGPRPLNTLLNRAKAFKAGASNAGAMGRVFGRRRPTASGRLPTVVNPDDKNEHARVIQHAVRQRAQAMRAVRAARDNARPDWSSDVKLGWT